MVLEECLGVWSGGEGGEMDPLQGCCAWKHFTALNPYVAGHGCKKTLKLRRQMNYVRHVRKITRKNCNDEK